MSDGGRERGIKAAREAGYAMGGFSRPAKGGRGGTRNAGPRAMPSPSRQTRNSPPPPGLTPPDPSMAGGAPAPSMAGGAGFKSGGSVKLPAPGTDTDGDSKTSTKSSGLKRGGRARK